MRYRILIPSIVFACDLQFLKDQLRITHNAHDLYLNSLIAAATDSATKDTGRQINFATLQASCGWDAKNCNRAFILERGPVVEIIEIQYLNTSGTVVDIPLSNYELVKNEYQGTIYLKSDFKFIDIDTMRQDAIRITYTAGWGEATNPFPELIRNAIALRAARFYTSPDDGVDEKVTVSQNLLRSISCPIV